jgi:hypothetical protein
MTAKSGRSLNLKKQQQYPRDSQKLPATSQAYPRASLCFGPNMVSSGMRWKAANKEWLYFPRHSWKANMDDMV